MSTLITPEMFGFGAVFVTALIFSVLTVIRQSKISVVYASFAFIMWIAEAGLNLLLFQATPSLLVLSWLWFAIGLFFEIVGVVLTFMALKADSPDSDLTL